MRKSRRQFAFGLALLVTAAVLGSGLAASGCKTQAKLPAADLPVVCQVDQRVFTLFAGFNASGYDQESTAAMDPVRLKVREAMASVDPKLLAPFRDILRQSTLETMASVVLQNIGVPPGFECQSVGTLLETSGAMKGLWKARGETLFVELGQAHADAAAGLAGPATGIVHSALAYAHEQYSPLASVQIVLNLLASTGFNSWSLDTKNKVGYIVVGPAEPQQLYTIATRFYYLYFGQDLFRQHELDGKLTKFSPVLNRAKGVERIDKTFASLQGFVEECLVRALGGKLAPAVDIETWKNAQYDAGFVLTPALFDALAGFEAAKDKTLTEYLPDLWAAIDVTALLAKMDAQPPTGR